MTVPRPDVAVTGAAYSEVGRRIGRTVLSLACESGLRAIEDAGLTASDIDGYCAYGGAGGRGFSGPTSYEVMDSLGIRPEWHTSGAEIPGQLGAVMNAALAIHAGMARHVLVQRTVAEATYGLSSQNTGSRGAEGGISGDFSFLLAFNAVSAANWLAINATRYMHEYGLTEEQLAWVALNGRRHAARNPRAIFRDPLGMDEYLGSRMISSPFHLYDCDVAVDGSTSFVISALDATSGLRHEPAVIESMGAAMRGRPLWDQWEDLTTTAARDAGAQLWTRTAYRPEDVDVAQLYDGFSFLTITWLEGLRLVPVGESGAFLQSGINTDLDGRLPLNTWGGQLSGGRLHGFGFLAEACQQLWGVAEDRQVTAKPVNLVAVGAGGGNTCGCLLIRRPE